MEYLTSRIPRYFPISSAWNEMVSRCQVWSWQHIGHCLNGHGKVCVRLPGDIEGATVEVCHGLCCCVYLPTDGCHVPGGRDKGRGFWQEPVQQGVAVCRRMQVAGERQGQDRGTQTRGRRGPPGQTRHLVSTSESYHRIDLTVWCSLVTSCRNN